MRQTVSSTFRIVALTLVAAASLPTGLAGQETREDLIRRAFEEFDATERIELLERAIDPAYGPTDSSWAVGVQLLAQTLIEERRESLARVWLRWALRLKPDLRPDTLRFLPQVAVATRRARSYVERTSTPDDARANVSWRWPSRFAGAIRGGLQVTAAEWPASARIRIEGTGRVPAGRSISLTPGSYRVEVAAEGYSPVELTREVLPGVTTVLNIDLRAPAVDELIVAAERSLVRLSSGAFGGPACAAGSVVSGSGLVLTTAEVVREGRNLEVIDGQGRRVFGVTRVAGFDAERNLAVLSVPLSWTDSLQIEREIAEQAPVWLLHQPECAGPSSLRTRVVTWENYPRGLIRLAEGWSPPARGGPVIDSQGNLVGIASASGIAIPARHAVDLLRQARRNVESGDLLSLEQVRTGQPQPEQQPVVRSRRKFPWALAALGVAGAGAVVAAVVSASGGGDGDDGGDNTGGIIITLPDF